MKVPENYQTYLRYRQCSTIGITLASHCEAIWYNVKNREIEKKVETYLEYCKYRKELDEKTLKAYQKNLQQYFDCISDGGFKKDETAGNVRKSV